MANRTDNFDRTNTLSNIGTPSDAGSAWVQQSGVWGIETNKGYKSEAASQATCVLESSEANADVQCTFSTAGVDGGLIARASNDSNYIMGATSTTTMRLFKRVAGTFTQLGSTFTGTISNGDVLKLTVNGNSITFYQNGVSRVTATDAFNNTATKHGLRSNDIDATRFEDFSITAITAGSNPKGPLNNPLSGPFGGPI